MGFLSFSSRCWFVLFLLFNRTMWSMYCRCCLAQISLLSLSFFFFRCSCQPIVTATIAACFDVCFLHFQWLYCYALYLSHSIFLQKNVHIYSIQKNIQAFPFSPLHSCFNVLTALVLRFDAVMYRYRFVVFTATSLAFACIVLLGCDFAHPSFVTLKEIIVWCFLILKWPCVLESL